jgi:hypothetical protein
MAWVSHGSRQYYYRTQKINGRYVCEYAGTGSAGEAAAEADAQRRLRRKEQAQQQQAEEQHWQAAVSPTDRFAEQTHLLLKALLLDAGYRQHDRGAWRRRHDRNDSRPAAAPCPKDPAR